MRFYDKHLLTHKTITTMAEDKRKKPEQLHDEQLDEVNGGSPVPSCNWGQRTETATIIS